jgi:hypothetical protein
MKVRPATPFFASWRRAMAEDASGIRFGRPNETGKVPIELACWIDGRLFGIEHASIQAFENQVKLSKDADDFFKPIEKAFSSVLPHSEQYVLYVPVTATQELKGLKPRKIKQTRDGIVDWVREVAPTLPVSPYFGALTWQSAAEVPFRMSLRNCGEVIDPDE